MGGGQSVKFLINQLVTSILEKEKRKKKIGREARNKELLLGGIMQPTILVDGLKDAFFYCRKEKL